MESKTFGYRHKKKEKDWADKARETEEKIERGKVKGVLFIPYNERSELAKRIRRKLKVYEELSDINVRVVEKTGERK